MAVKNVASSLPGFRSGAITFEHFASLEPVAQEVFNTARETAEKNINTLIEGEPGTGKNFLAQAVHNQGSRKEKPFILVNCSALDEAHLEAELFGSIQGSFGESVEVHDGRLLESNGGTLVLDEVGDMPTGVQEKLLKFLQTGAYIPASKAEEVKSDVRFLALTTQDLRRRIDGGTFNKDLYEKLASAIIKVPALRDRLADLSNLVTAYMQAYSKRFDKKVQSISKTAFSALSKYHWPDNLRELRNHIKQCILKAGKETILIEDFSLAQVPSGVDTFDPNEDLSMKAMECRHIVKVLRLTRGNKSQTSRILGISRPTLDKKISDYSIKMNFKEPMTFEESGAFDVQSLLKRHP